MWRRFVGFILEAVNGMVRPVQEKGWCRHRRKSVEILFGGQMQTWSAPHSGQTTRFLSYLSTTVKSFASLRTRNLTVSTYSLLMNSQ